VTTAITTLDQLAAHYPAAPDPRSLIKEMDHIDANYAAMIAASPFCVLATNGVEGLDCSPRGDAPGFVRVADRNTLMLPDRRGNNRLDSLKNIIGDPRVGLLFLIPGIGETLRVNGRATLSVEPELLASFAMQGKLPASVIVIDVDAVYFQCSRAIVRADLWTTPTTDRASVPTGGKILRDITAARTPDDVFDGETYDKALPERVKATLY
jgi:uncharacterized protein